MQKTSTDIVLEGHISEEQLVWDYTTALCI